MRMEMFGCKRRRGIEKMNRMEAAYEYAC